MKFPILTRQTVTMTTKSGSVAQERILSRANGRFIGITNLDFPEEFAKLTKTSKEIEITGELRLLKRVVDGKEYCDLGRPEIAFFD